MDGGRGDSDQRNALKEMPSFDEQELEEDEGEYVKPMTYDQLRVKALEKLEIGNMKAKQSVKQKKKK